MLKTVLLVAATFAMAPLPAQEQAAPAQATETPAPKAATLPELKAAMPRASAEFLVQCLEDGLTLDAARKRWGEKLEGELAAKDKEIAELKAKAEKKPVEPLASEGSAKSEKSDDPIAEWDRLVAEALDKQTGTKNKANAIAAVAKKNPELHRAYVEAYNARACEQG